MKKYMRNKWDMCNIFSDTYSGQFIGLGGLLFKWSLLEIKNGGGGTGHLKQERDRNNEI